MKKTLILFFLTFLIATAPVQANDSQRKTTSGRVTASSVIKNAPGRIFDIEILATGSTGYAIIMDTATALNPLGNNAVMLVEIGEATTGNSKHVNLGEYGIKAHKGIYLYLNNATAIVHYE